MTEEQNEKQIEEPIIEVDSQSSKKKKKSLLGLLFFAFIRFSAYFLIFFSLCLILLITALQFSSVRKNIIDFGLDYVNDLLIAKVEIDDINFFDVFGVSLSGVRLMTDGDTLANIEKLTIDLPYQHLIEGNLRFKNIRLLNPNLKMLRNEQGIWNYELIAKASEEKPEGGGDFAIEVDDLLITGANFLMVDSTVAEMEIGKLDYSNMEVQNLSMRLSNTAYDSKNSFARTRVSFMSFHEDMFQIDLRDFSGNVLINKRGIKLNKAHVDLNNTEVKFDASLLNFDILSGTGNQDIKYARVNLKLETKNVSPSEINLFASLPLGMRGDYKVKAEAYGSFDSLITCNAHVEFSDSFIDFKSFVGEVFNIEKLHYGAIISGSHIFAKDIKYHFPELLLPDIKYSYADIVKFDVVGDLEKAKGDIGVKSDVGNAKFYFETDWIKQYVVVENLIATNVQPTAFVPNEMLKGNVSLTGNFRLDNFANPKIYSNFRSEKSILFNSEIKDIKLVFRTNGMDKLYLDTLFARPFVFGDSLANPEISISSQLEMGRKSNPKYELIGSVNEVNLANMLSNSALPEVFSAKLNVVGEGFDLDSLKGVYNLDVYSLMMSDRALLPFSFDAKIEKVDDETILNVKSDFLDVDIRGNYKISSLIADAKNLVFRLTDFTIEQIDKVFKGSSPLSEDYVMKVFNTTDVNFKANIRDLSPLSLFLDSLEIYLNAEIEFNMNTNVSKGNINLSKFVVNNMEIIKEDMKFLADNLSFNASIEANMQDKVNSFKFNLNPDSHIYINELTFNSPMLISTYRHNKIEMNSSANINDILDYRLNSKIEIASSKVDFNFDTLAITYLDSSTWQNEGDVLLSFKPEGIRLNRMQLVRDNKERINIFGGFNQTTLAADSLGIYVSNFNLSDIKLVSGINNEMLNLISGKLNNFSYLMHGSLKNPKTYSMFNMSDIIIDKTLLGDLDGFFNHADSSLSGKINISQFGGKYANEIVIDIFNFPLNMGLIEVQDRLHTNQTYKISSNFKYVNFALLEPFVPMVSDLKGQLDGSVVFTGQYGQVPDYKGNAYLSDANMLVDNLNLYYNCKAFLEFSKNQIDIVSADLQNVRTDNPRSNCSVTGLINLDGVEISDLDLTIKIDGLKVLSNASKKSMPFLYGDFIVSTGEQPLRFWGSLTEPNISGDVDIMKADLKMPVPDQTKKVESKLIYEIKATEELEIAVKVKKDSIQNAKADELSQTGKTFNEIMNYDLQIRFPGRFRIDMDLNDFTNVNTNIGTKVRNQSIRYIKSRKDVEAKVIGEISVLDNSLMTTFGKRFTTTGSVGFPTGSIQNPSLDMIARYNGKTQIDGTTKDYEVQIKITGTKEKPIIVFSYTINEEPPAVQDPTQIQQDVIFLLTTGKTQTEFNKGQGQGGTLAGDTFNPLFASLLSQTLSQITTGSGLITGAEVNYTGNWNESTVKLKGRLGDDVQFSLGSELGDVQNNQFSIELPLSSLIDSDFLDNIILQFTYFNYSSNIQPGLNSREPIIWEQKIKYSDSW